MRRLMAFMAIFAFSGCGALEDVQICYEHPEYGAVCLKYNGKCYKRTDAPIDADDHRHE